MAASEIDSCAIGQAGDGPLQKLEITALEDCGNDDRDLAFIPPFIPDLSLSLVSEKPSDCHFSDQTGFSDDENMNSDDEDTYDPLFEEIKKTLEKDRNKNAGGLVSSSETSIDDVSLVNVSEHFTSLTYGLHPKDAYEHWKKLPDIMGVTYNGRMRQFVLLDSTGVVSWKRDAVENRANRTLTYPRHQYRLITYMVYAAKFNCYFALWKDFSLKVLDRDFVETTSVSANMRSVLFMLFNPLRDELITCGVDGTRVYHFHQASGKVLTEIKPLANYELTLRYELPNIGGRMVKKVDLDYNMGHLYCCSDTDLHVYSMEGKQLFKFQKAHRLSITGCGFSVSAKVLVTCSVDSEVKVWSLTGGLVHTFRGHSRAVTNLLIHPYNSSIIITCSLDGSLRMWSLDTMDALYTFVVSTCGLLWMGLTDDNLLYITTARSLTVWNLNHFIHFWSLTRNQVTKMKLEGCQGKTQRVMAVGEDSSVRLFSRKNQKNLSTVLPPPCISPLEQIVDVCYSREFNIIFVLINPKVIWVYTTRTDPACRIAVWDVYQLQSMSHKPESGAEDRLTLPSSKPGTSHRATENGLGNELPCDCLCVCILKSSAMLWTDEGCCCPVRHSYLLLGMEDGRVLFMDPVVKGQKFMEFKVSKDPVVSLNHDTDHNNLVTASRTNELMIIQFWSLPDLDLLFEVFCLTNLTASARIGMTCVTAHKSGHVLFHTMEFTNDPGFYRPRMPEVKDVSPTHGPEHQAPVITVDACPTMKIFVSCSNDGIIKVWEEGGSLLTEITLDDSLSAACFLNNTADLLVAFQKHIFFIGRSKVCPHLEAPEIEDDSFDRESYVYEDPAVVYDGYMEDPDPLNLEKYLVPYEIEFSKDFLEGKLTLEPMPMKEEDSDGEESTLSFAPTEIYQSEPSTPGSLSLVDLTLGSEITKYDLLQQMKSTLHVVTARERYLRKEKELKELELAIRQKMPSEKHKRRHKHGGKAEGKMSKADRAEIKAMQRELVELDREKELPKTFRNFVELPKFDGSPGPTPSITPSSTPVVPESESEMSEVEETVSSIELQLPKKKFTDFGIIVESLIQKENERKMDEKATNDAQRQEVMHAAKLKERQETEEKGTETTVTKRVRKKLDSFELDEDTLRQAKLSMSRAKVADHSHSRPSDDQRLSTTRKLSAKRFPEYAPGLVRQTDTKPRQRAVVKKKKEVSKRKPATVSEETEPVKAQLGASKQKEVKPVREASVPSKTGTSDSDSLNTGREERVDSVSDMISVDIKTLGSTVSASELAESVSLADVEGMTAVTSEQELLSGKDSRFELGMSPTAQLLSRPSTAFSEATSSSVGPKRRPSTAPSDGRSMNASVMSSREGDGLSTAANEEWELMSQDELFTGCARSVSPASSVFTYRLGDSPFRGDNRVRGDYQLSRLMDSQGYVDENHSPDRSYAASRTSMSAGTEIFSWKTSSSSSKATTVRVRSAGRRDGRPRSAVSRKKSLPPSAPLLSRRPRSAVTPGGARGRQDPDSRRRSQDKDRTALAEQLLFSLHNRSASTAGLPPLPPRTAASAFTEAANPTPPDGEDLDSTDAEIMAELPSVEVRYRPNGETSSPRVSLRSDSRLGSPQVSFTRDSRTDSPRLSLRSDGKMESPRLSDRSDGRLESPRSSLRGDSRRESPCLSAPSGGGFPPPLCPPGCVCRLPQAERDAALRRKKRISFHGESHDLGRTSVSATGRLGLGSRESLLGDEDLELGLLSGRGSPGQVDDEDCHRAWSSIGLPDPTLRHSGLHGERPSTTLLPARRAQFDEDTKQRPFTAAHGNFSREELKAVFEAALRRYQKVHSHTEDGSKLYSNKGVDFDGKWHERVIERHMLLRMQRLLRAYAAQQKRQVLQQQRLKSAGSHSQNCMSDGQFERALLRPSTANPAVLRSETMTPAPNTTPATSRPTTALPAPGRVPSMNQQKQMIEEKRQQLQAHREKQQLGDKQPFRFRMRGTSAKSPPPSPRVQSPRIDPWMLDPRNPSAVRPRSSKSIPSKCSRYVLLSRPRTGTELPVPSPLEEELLATRFPDQSVRILQSAGAAVRPTPPQASYCVTYSPFTKYG